MRAADPSPIGHSGVLAAHGDVRVQRPQRRGRPHVHHGGSADDEHHGAALGHHHDHPGTYVLVCTVPHHYVRNGMAAVLQVDAA